MHYSGAVSRVPVLRVFGGRCYSFSICFGDRNLFGIILGFFCFDYFWYVVLTWLPDYLVKGRSIPIGKAALLAALTFFIFGIAEPIGGWLADYLIKLGWNETRTRKGIVTVGWVTGLLLIPAGFAESNTTALICMFGAALVGLSTGNIARHSAMLRPSGQGGHLDGREKLFRESGWHHRPAPHGFSAEANGIL